MLKRPVNQQRAGLRVRYRPEIDGLRAIAVLAVILYHAKLGGLTGGYAGVDVFFVISGYLITALIARELSAGTYSVATFYERRARRILPPLFVVVAVSSPMALWTLEADELRDFSESVMAVGLMGSNFLFWLESGYFDTVAEQKPLLHTWSLAVEEQYYLLFPVLLCYFLGRRSRVTGAVEARWSGLWLTLAVTSVASFSLAHWGAYQRPVGTFYLIPTRAWELLIGAGWALYEVQRGSSSSKVAPWLQELGALTGLAMIGYACWGLDAQTPFPSAYALYPTLGAMLVIAMNRGRGPAHWLLTRPTLRHIGLVSYSAYLWHQPLLAFATRSTLTAPPLTLRLGLIAMTFTLAELSWRYVERPSRDRSRASSSSVIKWSVIGSLTLILSGLLGSWLITPVHELKVGRERLTLPPHFIGLTQGARRCSGAKLTGERPCVFEGQPSEQAYEELFIIGDSHARVISGPIAQRRERYHRLHDLTASACPFVIERAVFRGREQVCGLEEQEARLRYIEEALSRSALPPARSLVVLVAYWPQYHRPSPFTHGAERHSRSPDMWVARSRSQSRDEASPDYVHGLIETLKRLERLKLRVALVLPAHSNGWSPVERAKRLARSAADLTALYRALEVPYEAVDAWERPFRIALREALELAQKAGNLGQTTLIDARPLFCDRGRGRCVGGSPDERGQPTLWFTDEHHLSQRGAMRVTRELFMRVGEGITPE